MRLTENMIIARSKQSDLSAIKRINLWGCDLTDISIVESMTNVEVLALSINNLSSLEPLEACSKLQVLYLRKNNISDFNELKYLQNLPFLTELWLAENPCAVRAGSSYRACVLKILPKLKKLDNDEITALDIEEAKKLDFSKLSLECCPYDLPMEGLNLKQELELAELTKSERASPTYESFRAKPRAVSPVQESFRTNAETFRSMEECDYNQQYQAQSPSPSREEKQTKQEDLDGFVEERYENSPLSTATFQATSKFETQRSQRQSLPVSLHSRSEEQHEFQAAQPQVLNKTQSLNQIPQLKLVLQIQPPAGGGGGGGGNKEYPEWTNEQNGAEDTPRNRNDYYSDRAGYTNQNANRQRLEQGSRTSRTNASHGHKNDSGWNSRTNQDSNSQESRRNYQTNAGHQTHRTVNLNLNTNDNLSWQDGHQTSRSTRSSTSRASDSSSTFFSSKSSRRTANVLSALLCIVPELDIDSLQVLEHSIQCRLDELNE